MALAFGVTESTVRGTHHERTRCMPLDREDTAMDCPDCGAETMTFAVPSAYGECVPEAASTLALCPRCLHLHPVPADAGVAVADVTPESPDQADAPAFERVGDAFPTDPDAAIPMAILVGLLDSLALYREEIATLLDAVERAGTDPLLVIDRLAADPAVETDVELARRRHQLEQLL